jgi:S-adenosylmethionine hydrolase
VRQRLPPWLIEPPLLRYAFLMIATFTDFGAEGPYLGQVRAALLQAAPEVAVIDLFTDLPACDVMAAAYLLPAYSQYLPPGSICLCVVDPGVGGDRAAVAVQADRRWYVGPDNGLFAHVIRRAESVAVVEIAWRPQRLSSSFHGRDLFAPVCAMLARTGQVPGRAVNASTLQRPDWPDDLNRVVYVDHYGNVITGLRAGVLAADARIEIAGVNCDYRRTFGDAAPNRPFWYANSNGLVEIAIAGASAALALRVTVGQAFTVVVP